MNASAYRLGTVVTYLLTYLLIGGYCPRPTVGIVTPTVAPVAADKPIN